MTLSDGQVQVGDLVMGPATQYQILNKFNPFLRAIRADQSGVRAWNHGSWSGAEWAEEAVVPIGIVVSGSGTAGWLAAHQQLMAAFAPSSSDVELRFMLGGTEYLMFGRPRMVEPEVDVIGLGYAITKAAFVALDPRIYSGTEHTSGVISLPSQAGGLLVPMFAPLRVAGVLVGGSTILTNAGTTDTGLLLRVDGPVPDPAVTVQRPDGSVQTLRIMLELTAGQWLDIDTKARTVFLNGLASASRRGDAVGEFPLLPPGTSTLRFSAADSAAGTLTATYRDAWW